MADMLFPLMAALHLSSIHECGVKYYIFFIDRGCYFQVGNSVKLGMSIATAFRTALNTWASWVDNMINPNRTHVFFRTFEPSHWRYTYLTFVY